MSYIIYMDRLTGRVATKDSYIDQARLSSLKNWYNSVMGKRYDFWVGEFTHEYVDQDWRNKITQDFTHVSYTDKSGSRPDPKRVSGKVAAHVWKLCPTNIDLDGSLICQTGKGDIYWGINRDLIKVTNDEFRADTELELLEMARAAGLDVTKILWYMQETKRAALQEA